MAGAAFCSILNVVHESWAAGFAVKPGWMLPLLVVGFLFALPGCFVVGLPFRA